MVATEAALARAEASVGIIPADAAAAITAACQPGRFSPSAIGVAAVASGNVVIPLVRELTAAVGEPHCRWVHWGATSQDISDTAFALVLREAISGPLDTGFRTAAAAAADLAARHRTTPMAARTLLQQALPTSFGLKAAGWLTALDSALAALAGARANLAVQLGGAAGTLAALGPSGLAVIGAFARETGLAEPVLPWHADRGRIVTAAAALALAAGTAGKVAGDLVLLAQTEIGEVAEHAAPGRGGSSTLPHKRNPVASVAAVANARRAAALTGQLLASMDHEHERAAGAWQAEWVPLLDSLRCAGGAGAQVADALSGLEVRPERMAANLAAAGGFSQAEAVQTALAPHLGRLAAHDLVEAACHRALDRGTNLHDELAATPAIAGTLDADALAAALDPANYLGSAADLVDRALAAHADAPATAGHA
jgi:3-carboxy-cis,cis-muconate cycloisomerase